jgi:hypothetical protein
MASKSLVYKWFSFRHPVPGFFHDFLLYIRSHNFIWEKEKRKKEKKGALRAKKGKRGKG